MSSPAVIQCRNLAKRYGKQWAVDHLNLEVREGEIFGFLGPNGAGKTTLIKMLLGLATPTSGQIELFGEDLYRHRHRLVLRVGAVVEAPIFFEYLSGRENLWRLVSLGGKVNRERIDAAMETVGLTAAAAKKVGAYSYGMKQRLGIAQALLPDTRLLILDEPTNGLDPHGIVGIRNLIRRLRDEGGMTVFVSSHILSEVEQLCDRITIINRGKTVLEGTVEDLRRECRQLLVRVRGGDNEAALLRRLSPATLDREDGILVARFVSDPEDAPDLVRHLVERHLDVLEVHPERRTLEDIFIEHTRSEADDVRVDAF